MDKDLRFSEHVSKGLQKAYLNLKFIYNNREFCSRKHKAMLCESLVLSQLNGDVVYGPCLSAVDANRIEKVQNSCLRLIFGIRKFERISHTLQLAGWLNMKNRRLLHSMVLFFKILSNKSPPYLINKITYRCDVHNLNIRFRGTLTPPATETFKHSFSYNVANHPNNVPQFIKKIDSFQRFKSTLAKWLQDKQNWSLTV